MSVAPHFEMNFGGGTHPMFGDEFCLYASIYREGLNSNSAFYRFLCFYKIIESLIAKRGREGSVKKQAGKTRAVPTEVESPKGQRKVWPYSSDYLLGASNGTKCRWGKFPRPKCSEKGYCDSRQTPPTIAPRHSPRLLDKGEITVVLK